MIQVGDLYEGVAKSSGSPIVVFNGELDRIRSGYYPALFFPKLGQLAKTFIPKFETAFYIHNFKGSRGGTVQQCHVFVNGKVQDCTHKTVCMLWCETVV